VSSDFVSFLTDLVIFFFIIPAGGVFLTKMNVLQQKYAYNFLLRQNRLLLHVGFWACFWLLTSVLPYLDRMQTSTGSLSTAYLRSINTLLLSEAEQLLLFMAGAYFNFYFLFPYLWQKGRHLLYGLVVVGLALALGWMSQWVMFFNMAHRVSFLSAAGSALAVVLMTTAIKLFRYNFRQQLAYSQLQNKLALAELDLLKGQINPHFLFNTLNNIYGLHVDKSGQVAQLILRLADLMRYSTTIARLPSVPLEQEIRYLDNYLQLEKVRFEADACIRLVQQGEMSSRTIAPLLLLPFVENAFKHGASRQSRNIRVEITAALQGEDLYFEVINSKPLFTENKVSTRTGLENVRQRLQLLYPGRHELNIYEEAERYTVNLWIKLSAA
jgi:two-component system, LytTR family, sensor kinase